MIAIIAQGQMAQLFILMQKWYKYTQRFGKDVSFFFYYSNFPFQLNEN